MHFFHLLVLPQLDSAYEKSARYQIQLFTNGKQKKVSRVEASRGELSWYHVVEKGQKSEPGAWALGVQIQNFPVLKQGRRVGGGSVTGIHTCSQITVITVAIIFIFLSWPWGKEQRCRFQLTKSTRNLFLCAFFWPHSNEWWSIVFRHRAGDGFKTSLVCPLILSNFTKLLIYL